MAWTATLLDLGKRQNNEGAQVLTVLYTDGASKVVKDYALSRCTKAILEQLARSEVARLVAEPPIVDVTGLTAGMVIDLTPPADLPPTPPTPEQQAQQAFFILWRRSQAQQRAILARLLDPADKGVTETATALAAAFLPAYLELL